MNAQPVTDATEAIEEVTENTEEKTVAVEAPTLVPTPLSVNKTIEYAPKQPPVQGTYSLCVAVIQWKNQDHNPVNADSVARRIARVYKALSNDQLIFETTARSVPVTVSFASKNLNNAEMQVKNQVGKFDFYAIINGGVRGYSYAGGNTAHLTSKSNACHLVGLILPMRRLGHSGKYYGARFDPYGDDTSFMGKCDSNRITASQLYHLGWLEEAQVAQHEITAPTTDYQIEDLYAENDNGYLKAIRIPRETGREIFVSVVPVKVQHETTELRFFCHYRDGGKSQCFKIFEASAEIDDGLVLQKMAEHEDHSTLRIGLRA